MDFNYNGTTVNETKCYSSISNYGSDSTVNPRLRTIINPVPAVAVPQIFCKFKPHGIYQPPELSCNNCSCNYKNLSCMKTCDLKFCNCRIALK
jgi:hypothetical protein